MGMRLEIRLSSAPVGYVGVELGGREVGVAEHLLDAAEVRPALEQVRGERVPEQVGMDPLRLEPRASREPPQDEERARARERAALRVQEELGPVAPVEERTTAGEVAAQRLGRLAADRDDPLLVALAEAADEPVLEVDAAPLERHRLRDAQARAVEELGERAVAEVARLRAGGRLDEPLGLRRRERARKPARAARKVEVGGRIVAARAEERLVAEERAQRRRAPRDRRGREPLGAQLGEVPLEVVGARPADRLPEPGSDGD